MVATGRLVISSARDSHATSVLIHLSIFFATVLTLAMVSTVLVITVLKYLEE